MWTKEHRARHEPRLKDMVSQFAEKKVARWLERADPPRSEVATPTLAVVRAIAWHLRVGGPWRAFTVAPAAVADGVWLVPTLAGTWSVRPPDVGGCSAAAACGGASFDADTGNHRHTDGQVHRRARPAWL